MAADACHYGWGATCLQMASDLTYFNLLMMVGGSIDSSHQAWPPLVLEGYAQLMGKRVQRRNLGPMRSICWIDHANLTKQQNVGTADIDLKILRWLAEILQDGSEIRSLAGRNCRLADGTSRNPKERNRLIEGRTSNLKGVVGMLTNFNIDKFNSLCEDENFPLGWALNRSSAGAKLAVETQVDPYAASARATALDLDMARIMTAAGVSPTLSILYVSDHVQSSVRIMRVNALTKILERCFHSIRYL